MNTKPAFLLSFLLILVLPACSTLTDLADIDAPPEIQQVEQSDFSESVYEDYTPVSFEITGNQAIMTGVIDDTTPDEVLYLIEDHPNVDTIIMLDVEGSVDDEYNIEASLLIYEYSFTIIVPSNGVIASGGVDFFFAGAVRIIEPGGQLGVHSWADSEGIDGDDLPRNHPDHFLYLDYFDAIGISPDFYWFTLSAASPEDIHWMTAAEIQLYGIETE